MWGHAPIYPSPENKTTPLVVWQVSGSSYGVAAVSSSFNSDKNTIRLACEGSPLRVMEGGSEDVLPLVPGPHEVVVGQVVGQPLAQPRA